MKKPPIFYTIGQIQFSPVLGMAKFVPDIQEELRRDFPDFQRGKIANVQIKAIDENVPVQVVTQERWHFNDLNRTSGYLLQPQSLVFHTTAYETSEHFLQKVLGGISIVQKYAELTYIESVSIRTLDAVIPEPDQNVREYLNPAVRGLSEGLDGHLKHSVMESLWEVPPHGVLISRVAIVKGALATPMDLFPLALELKPELRKLDLGEHALVDSDRQHKERFAFDPEEIRRRLLVVKRDATLAFQKSVSQFALERWN
ncbi:MAG TPA: TIGR04255 family protein [Candidatus Acidoferrum sp.]|nr:TIGR04255 family protein [Candidatus Acidoferrum sp.]